jgi:hypothetical protein
VTSSTVSPFILQAVIKAPICAGVASPPMISSIAAIISDSDKSILQTTLSIASLIMINAPFV